MKKLKLQNLALIALFAGMLSIYSCSEDEKKTPAPEADFTVSIEGKVVTIENTSTDAETYAWDFGDGGTSTEMSPVYTYVANGSYVITLTATNETGEDSKSSAIEIINISIDGDVSDWADVASLATYTDGEAGSILDVKVENLEDDKLFIYLKTTDATNGFIDLYLNTDNDATTGFSSWLYPNSYGIDVLFEGYVVTPEEAAEPFLGSYDNATAGDDHTAWAWTTLTPSATFLSTHTIGTGSTVEIEFAISLSELPASILNDAAIEFFIVDVDAPDEVGSDWSWLGNAPAPYGEETSAAFSYTLK